MKSIRIDITGQVFGRLSVLNYSHSNQKGRAYWNCQCSCGNTKVAAGSDLKTGHTTSCGCLRKEIMKVQFRKHGMSHTKLHKVWRGMLERCVNPNNNSYENYGGRGITVCPEWLDFTRFYADMGDRPTPNHSLDRIDTDGNYEPSNCRWATKLEQSNNTRSNRPITYLGETKTIAEWGRHFNMLLTTIRGRLKKGLPLDKVFYNRSLWTGELVQPYVHVKDTRGGRKVKQKNPK